jgi:phosphoribosyl 1,2-cyclic phosphodiesterase
LDFKDFNSGDRLDLGDGIVLRTATLNHPDGATGYRVEYQGHSICYITDTEHVESGPDQNILALIKDADIVIYDSTYTDDEFPQFVGYGHSTWQEGMRLCRQSNVKTFVVFHHDPDHDDTFMDRVASEVDAELPGALVAREGLTLRP